MISDRIAQTVVKRYLEPLEEPVFHNDSYGYRPGRSAHQALDVARQRCWNHDWVLDLDIKNFFGSMGTHDAAGALPYGLCVGAAVYRALAQGARAHAGRDRSETG